jgi:hypothetical protein
MKVNWLEFAAGVAAAALIALMIVAFMLAVGIDFAELMKGW